MILKEYLDQLQNEPYSINCNATIIVYNGLFSNTRYEQSIRWFYAEPNKDMLNKEIMFVDEDYTIYGYKTLRIFLKY